MYGCKAAKKKEIEKGLLKVDVPMIFVKGNYFETPLYTMCWINEGGDKERLWEQGAELGGGGGGGHLPRQKG